jgi:hypothetical protein
MHIDGKEAKERTVSVVEVDAVGPERSVLIGKLVSVDSDRPTLSGIHKRGKGQALNITLGRLANETSHVIDTLPCRASEDVTAIGEFLRVAPTPTFGGYLGP